MIIKNGQFWNGDCLELMKFIPDGSVDMILTDVPYNEVNRKSSGLRKLNKGLADSTIFDEFSFIEECVRVCKGSIYIFCGSKQFSSFINELEIKGLSTRIGVWSKPNPSPMNGEKIWLSGSELCVYGKKAKATYNEHCKSSVWVETSVKSKIHPTQKPVKLFERLILASSNPNCLILDPFAGSGTTAIAAERTGRKWICIEKDPAYYFGAVGRVWAE